MPTAHAVVDTVVSDVPITDILILLRSAVKLTSDKELQLSDNEELIYAVNRIVSRIQPSKKTIRRNRWRVKSIKDTVMGIKHMAGDWRKEYPVIFSKDS